ncbi:glycoside hydrolase family 79 protein [Mycena galericulata]|nr:glycoside hydrolase family 79 protein [Mycena galericulata]
MHRRFPRLSFRSQSNRYISERQVSHEAHPLRKDRWIEWAGTTSRNTYFFNTLNNLKEITGSPPDIRIGANSEDKTNFNPLVEALEVKAIVNAFSSPSLKAARVTLDYLEIGNEADLYANNASSYGTTGFSPGAIYAENILTLGLGSLIAAFSQHHYSGSFCAGNGGLLQDLMTKSTIRSNLTIYAADVNATRARGLDYILGETNSYACHGAPGVSNTAGAALWALDYALFATQVGISKIMLHNGVGFKYNLIQPVTLTRSILDDSSLTNPLPPHVQPPYYAAIIAAELIGCKENVRISEIITTNTHIAGYAAFEEEKLARAIFINLQAFLQGDANRSSIHLALAFTGEATPTSSG